MTIVAPTTPTAVTASTSPIAPCRSGCLMANTKGARKAGRQAEKARKHNASMRSALPSAIKSVTKAIAAGDKAGAWKIFSEASGIMDRIADKKVIHKNEAARHKSRLAARLRAMPG